MSDDDYSTFNFFLRIGILLAIIVIFTVFQSFRNAYHVAEEVPVVLQAYYGDSDVEFQHFSESKHQYLWWGIREEAK